MAYDNNKRSVVGGCHIVYLHVILQKRGFKEGELGFYKFRELALNYNII